MPIRKSQRELYPVDWPRIRAKILDRAGNRCEWCSKPDRETVLVDQIGAWTTDPSESVMVPNEALPEVWHEAETQTEIGRYLARPDGGNWRELTVVLTVAHLDHDPTNNVSSNLRALCQRCHNVWDAPARAAGRAYRKLSQHVLTSATLTIVKRSSKVIVTDPGPPDRPYREPQTFDIRPGLLEVLNKLEW